MEDLMKNPILSEIINLFQAQQAKGLEKYGELVNIDAYSVAEWIEHAQQECVDKLVYLEAIKQKMLKEKPL